VEAHPGAKLQRIELVGQTLRVWVRARAVDGQANAAVEESLAQAFGLRNRQVRIVSGLRSRRKTVEIDLADVDEARRRLVEFNRG
jgi:uncharacterized protein YggU (UPF0235/DUF167 family)